MPEFIPGLEGVPAARSSISFVDGDKGILEYRGIRIEVLAEQSSYEEVAFLLLRGRLPTEGELRSFAEDLNNARQVPDGLRRMIESFPKDAHPMAVLQTSVAAMAMFAGPADFSQAAAREQHALQIIARTPTILAAFHRSRNDLEVLAPDTSLSHAADFLRMTTGKDPDRLSARVIDVALILHADHTMNASTFTARVTGSTGAGPYAVVCAAVGSLSGPLHGGATERVLEMLKRIGKKDRVRRAVSEMLAGGERIAGLGHRVYKVKDPRANILQKLAGDLFEKTGKSPLYGVALRLEKVAGELLAEKGVYPNVDFYSGIVYDKLGLPADMFTPVFAVARSAGWLAHWLEQMSDNRLFRPRQVYEGEHNVAYTPITERDA